jgi:hypothetical protein
MSEATIFDRRRFLANTFMTIAAAQLGMTTMSKPEANTSFSLVKGGRLDQDWDRPETGPNRLSARSCALRRSSSRFRGGLLICSS